LEIVVRILFLLGGLALLAVWRKTSETLGGYVLFKCLSRKARALVGLAVLCGTLQLFGVKIGVLFPKTLADTVIGLALFGFGVGLATWGKLTLGSNWDPHKEKRPVIAWGAYRFCRHPIYLGGFLAAVGAEIALGSILFLLAIPGFFVLRAAAISEENLLIGCLGGEYRDYQWKVRRFLIF
jgi:protein-S-isoprenylcysteine O-methyltransferase Ste14